MSVICHPQSNPRPYMGVPLCGGDVALTVVLHMLLIHSLFAYV